MEAPGQRGSQRGAGGMALYCYAAFSDVNG